MDEKAEIKLVIMGIADYERMAVGGSVHTEQKPRVDIEAVNQQITKAQLSGETTPVDLPVAGRVERTRVDMRAEVIDPSFDFDSPATLDEFEV